MAAIRCDMTAYALPGELDLSKLAASMGSGLRYRWEEPMLLDPVELVPFKRSPEPRQTCVWLYHFGAVVFAGCPQAAIDAFLAAMRRFSPLFSKPIEPRFTETYAIEAASGTDPSPPPDNNRAVVPSIQTRHVDIAASVLAKSVALERIEDALDVVLDDVESLIGHLRGGKLSIGDRRLARLASSILEFKYASLSHVMVLDEPESAWDDPEAARLYAALAETFELTRRFGQIRIKSETLMDVTEVFSSISHARRSTMLEWTIIVLIAIEIVLSLIRH